MSPFRPGARGLKGGAAGLAGLALAVYLAAGFYTIRGTDGELGVALRFGRVVQNGVPAGVSWNLPRPFGEVRKVKTGEQYRMSVGFRMDDSVRGLPPLPAEVEWVTGDTNVINVRMVVQYVISDPAAYLFSTESTPLLLRRFAENALTEIVGSTPVDEVLTVGQRAIAEKVKGKTNALVEAAGAGVRVVSANFIAVEPPPAVRQEFAEVQNAEADKVKRVSEAAGYANDILPKARGEAQSLLFGALAEKGRRVETARGEADRFSSVLAEYRKAPSTTRARLYLEAMEKILPRVRKYVVEPSSPERGSTSLKIMEPR